jgi:hypothetical protein
VETFPVSFTDIFSCIPHFFTEELITRAFHGALMAYFDNHRAKDKKNKKKRGTGAGWKEQICPQIRRGINQRLQLSFGTNRFVLVLDGADCRCSSETFFENRSS